MARTLAYSTPFGHGGFTDGIFPSTHANLLLDVDFTDSAAVAAAGFTESGTGHTYDANGWKASAGYLRKTAFDFSTVTPQGTALLLVERAKVAYDDSQRTDAFANSDGDANAVLRYIADFNSNPYTGDMVRFYVAADTGTPETRQLSIAMRGPTGTTTQVQANFYNSHQGALDPESDYVQMIVTWRDREWHVYFDGLLMEGKTKPASQECYKGVDDLYMGSDSGGNNQFDGYIKRLQITSDFLAPKKNRTRIALYGDSFIQVGTARTNEAAETVVAYDAVQNNLTLGGNDGTNKDRHAFLIGNARNQNNWFWCLSRWFWLEYGEQLLCYNGGNSGSGHGTMTGVTQFTAEQRDAIIAYNPEILITFGSVNDINYQETVTDANTYNQVVTAMDDFIDNAPSLRKILFFGGFSAHNIPTKQALSGWDDTFYAYHQNLSKIDGYRDIVKFIPTWQAWGGYDVPATYINGSHPDNLTTSGPSNNGDDVHPSAVGHIRIAEIVWPHLVESIGRRTRSFF